MNDEEKLRMLAHWFDLLDAELDYDTEPEIQDCLRRTADMLGATGNSDKRKIQGGESDRAIHRQVSPDGDDIPIAGLYLIPVDKRSKSVCFKCRKWVDDCRCTIR